MPKEGLNIYFTITDKGSPVLTALGDKTKVLDKETQSLAQSYAALQKANEPLIRKQTELKALLEAKNKVVSEARKNYKKYGDEMSESKLKTAIDEQNELKKSLMEVDGQLRSNQKTYAEYQDTIRKSVIQDNSQPNLGFGLISGQIGDMLSSSIGGFADSALSSAFGSSAGSLVSSGISDAITGAMAGMTFGPTGALIGGIAGAASGLISGGTQVFEAKDDAFRDYYGGLYDEVSARTDEMVESGSTIAGGREQTRQAFVQRFKDEEKADAYLAEVKSMASGTNYDYDEIVGYSKLLLNSYDPEQVFGVLQSLSDVTAGLSLNSSDVNMMIAGLSRMRTTGKATQEYLNYFSERGVDVYQALSDATGADKKNIAKMVSKGSIGGETAAQAILDYINKEYGGLSEDLMSTYDAMTDNLADIMANLNAAGGEGYNEMRKEGLEADMTAYSGALGTAMEEINRISGENRAYLENLSGQYQREALEAVLLGSETTVFSDEDRAKLDGLSQQYAEAKESYEAGNQEAGLLMESYRESAEAVAKAAYESSDQYLALKDTEMDQIEAIRENTEGLAAATAAYRESQERSKGVMGNFFEDFRNNLSWTGLIPSKEKESDGSKHAYGLHRVPYDDYPALLHEGERVLTAAEARAQDREAPPTLLRSESHFLSVEDHIRRVLGEDDFPTLTRQKMPFPFSQDMEWPRYAYGLNRVPYDNYPALLHEGERVLTADEAREQDMGERPPTLLSPDIHFESVHNPVDNSNSLNAPSLRLAPSQSTESQSLTFFDEREDAYPKLIFSERDSGTYRSTSGQSAPTEGHASNPVDNGLAIQVSVTGNTFTAAGEELADQIAEVIARKTVEAVMLAVPR